MLHMLAPLVWVLLRKIKTTTLFKNLQYSLNTVLSKYLGRNDGVGAGEDPALLSSHHDQMGGCTQIYCFLLAPPAAHTFPAHSFFVKKHNESHSKLKHRNLTNYMLHYF